jgi:hypothetical protein
MKLVSSRGDTGTGTVQPEVQTDPSGTGTVFAYETSTSTALVVKPSQIMTLQRLANGLSLVFPLYVSVEQSGEEWLATSADLALIGRGDSDLESLDDLRAQVTELYESLLEMRDSLGPHMVQQLAFLERLAGHAADR